jgi:hypothetical protein
MGHTSLSSCIISMVLFVTTYLLTCNSSAVSQLPSWPAPWSRHPGSARWVDSRRANLDRSQISSMRSSLRRDWYRVDQSILDTESSPSSARSPQGWRGGRPRMSAKARTLLDGKIQYRAGSDRAALGDDQACGRVRPLTWPISQHENC